jgi:NADH-quinone oxidoreductase subunit C
MIDTTGLENKFPEAIVNREEFRGEVTVTLKREALLPVCTFLRDDPEYAFRFLVDVTAVDYEGRPPRFVVVYHLLSQERNSRLRLKVPLDGDDLEIESVTAIWPTADWHERETYDMFGISFLHHPDLRRILLPDSWDCHPLRKDYPLEGRGET